MILKVKIDKTQQNSECWLCVDGDKMINDIISECRKPAQKRVRLDMIGL